MEQTASARGSESFMDCSDVVPVEAMKDHGFTICQAVSKDAEVLARLIHELAVYERLEDHVTVTPEALVKTLLLPGSPTEAYLGLEEDSPVGFVVIYTTFSTFLGRYGLYIHDLYVGDAHRGKGYGQALFQHVVDLARQRDCARIEWEVLNWNEPAIRFYKRLGAVPLNDWTMFRLDSF